MDKKSQLTLFIIIGMVIVIIFSMIFYLGMQDFVKFNQFSPKAKGPVGSYVQSCLEFVSNNATKTLLMHGGQKDSIPYDSLPSIESMETVLEITINSQLDSCINNFIVFRDEYDIKTGFHKTQVSINQNDIFTSLNFPVEIKKGDSEEQLSDFSYLYQDINLPYIKQLAEDIINSGEWLDNGYLLQELTTNNLQLRVISYNSKILYSINTNNNNFNFGETI